MDLQHTVFSHVLLWEGLGLGEISLKGWTASEYHSDVGWSAESEPFLIYILSKIRKSVADVLLMSSILLSLIMEADVMFLI